MATPLKPSAALLAAIQGAGGISAAAKAWGVEFNSLNRFVRGTGGISLTTAVRIAVATNLQTGDLYDQHVAPTVEHSS